MRARYNLPQQNVVGIDHALGYAALANGSIDVKDAYSTDAKISENDLITLEDDLQFFPRYNAVFLYRLSLPASTITALRRLEGTLDETRMIRLNAEAERTKNYARAANLFFEGSRSSVIAFGETFFHKLKRWTLRHLELAGISLVLSVLVGVPLGIFASRGGTLGQRLRGDTAYTNVEGHQLQARGPVTLAKPCGFSCGESPRGSRSVETWTERAPSRYSE